MATCSPSELLASGSCFQCLTKKELQIVIAQLLCEIQAGGGGGSSPKVYRALLSQSGTDAPAATVLENTLGGVPVWLYSGVGAYNMDDNALFPANKTVAFFSHSDIASGAKLSLYSGGPTWLFNLISVGGDGTTPANDVIYLDSIEILVYP